MDDGELRALFVGYGYDPMFVDVPAGGRDSAAAAHWSMATALDSAYRVIRWIQETARLGRPTYTPRWPLVILRSPKGWTVIEELGGKRIEGPCRSHQVPVDDVRANPEHLQALELWLRSYRPRSSSMPTAGPPRACLRPARAATGGWR